MSFFKKSIIVIGALAAVVSVAVFATRTPQTSTIELVGNPSPYLLIFAGDSDKSDSDFLTVIDANPNSETVGEPLHSVSTGMTDSMPHHMEYTAPPAGEPLFMNAHHHEMSMIVDISDLSALKIQKTITPPKDLRFPHDYTRTPSGTRLVGFLRSDGASPDNEETLTPANHGGIAEYSQSGELLRTASSAVDGLDKAVRPYAFALLPEIDRFVVTSAPMMETSWAEVLQIYRYSDFKLLNTLKLPKRHSLSGKKQEIRRATGFGPRVLDDGSVLLNTYECSFYHLTDIDTDAPKLDVVHTVEPDSSRPKPDHCGIPVRVGQYWIQPVGKSRSVVVLDIQDPQDPKEVYRLNTPDDFSPHWLAKDPRSNRLILGAELGGEQGFYVLRVDESSGALDYDDDFRGLKSGRFFKSKDNGYISLERDEWPHGNSGNAWGHAALFLDQSSAQSGSKQAFEDTDFLFAGTCLPPHQTERSIQ